MHTVIEIKKIVKKYGEISAVKGINLKVKSGEIFALLGINGAGKTTTIKMLLGLTNPSSGQIRYLEKNFLTSKSELLPRIGSVVENTGFFRHLTAYENLELITNLIGFNKKDHIHEVLDTVSLLAFRNVKVKKLTQSQRQKLAIGRALLNSPDILILDEPMNGLDPISINEIRTILSRLAKERSVTIFISSHILSEVEKLADRIGIIHQGRLLEVITKDEFKDKHTEFIILKVKDESTVKALLDQNLVEYRFMKKNELFIHKEMAYIPKLIKMLTENNIKINEIYSRDITLEDYFIDLIENY